MSSHELVITLGDPRSCNIELLLASYPSWPKPFTASVVIVGSWTQWVQQTKGIPLPESWPALRPMTDWPDATSALSFFDIDTLLPSSPSGSPSQLSDVLCGLIAWHSLQAVKLARSKRLAVVTLPISKYRAAKAGMPFPGQTEFFEGIWQGEAVMLLAGPRLRVGLATNHLRLADVPQALTVEGVTQKLRTLAFALPLLVATNPIRIGVCGLNPHASDGGLFGDEEAKVLVPAIAAATAELGARAAISGPLPADTAFYHAAKGRFDAVLAMYHDQGLGPLKLLHFSDAINVSLGLKHLRVAPDHGPAEDLIGKGTIDASSSKACFDVAWRYVQGEDA